MFGSLKKKLKDVVSKFSKEEDKKEEKAPEQIQEKVEIEKEVIDQQPLEEAPEEVKKEIIEEQKEIEKLEEDFIEAEEDLEKEVPGEIEEKVHEKAQEIKTETFKEESPVEKAEIFKEEKIGDLLEKKEEVAKKLEEILEEPIDEELIEEEIKEEERYEEPEVVAPIKEEKKGFFGKIIKRVSEKKLEEDEVKKLTEELKKAMLESDVAYEVADKICDQVAKDLAGKEVSRRKIEDIVKESLEKAMLDAMSQDTVDLEKLIESKKPLTILILGFNGTGKTTTIAKLAHKLKKKYKVVLAAGDTFRAASIEQLQEHGRRLNVNLIYQKYGSDSAAVIFDARKHAQANGIDVVLADTAGRSHSNVNLMDELKKVCRVNKPELKILVLDSLTGNDIYNQSKLFDDAVGVDAIILTKADVYEKGGAALSASHTINKPILYLGTGQDYEDLKEFNPQEIVKNLLG